jgi:hypothetical protein
MYASLSVQYLKKRSLCSLSQQAAKRCRSWTENTISAIDAISMSRSMASTSRPTSIWSATAQAAKCMRQTEAQRWTAGCNDDFRTAMHAFLEAPIRGWNIVVLRQTLAQQGVRRAIEMAVPFEVEGVVTLTLTVAQHRQMQPHPSRRGEDAAPQDKVLSDRRPRPRLMTAQ